MAIRLEVQSFQHDVRARKMRFPKTAFESFVLDSSVLSGSSQRRGSVDGFMLGLEISPMVAASPPSPKYRMVGAVSLTAGRSGFLKHGQN